MSLRALEIMVGRAVTSDQFLKGIMNGRRAELLQEYHLEPDEFADLMSIRADTAGEFYAAVERILATRDPRGRMAGLGDTHAEFDRKVEAAMLGPDWHKWLTLGVGRPLIESQDRG